MLEHTTFLFLQVLLWTIWFWFVSFTHEGVKFATVSSPPIISVDNFFPIHFSYSNFQVFVKALKAIIQINYRVNHNITNFKTKQKIFWKFDKKDKGTKLCT